MQIGDTPLLWSAYYNNKEVAELLIKYGADINMKNYVSITLILRVWSFTFTMLDRWAIPLFT